MTQAGFNETDLIEALRECYVPALRRDVVSAGLLRSASLARDPEAPGAGIAGVPERFVAHLALWAAAGSDDGVNAQVRAAVENRLLGLYPIVRVELTLLPPLFPILG